MSEHLDTLLSRPLPGIPDNGFSSRVMAQMELQQLRRDRLKMEILIGLVILAVLILPFTGAGELLAASAFTNSGMVLASLAVGAIFAFSAFRTVRR